MLRSSTMGPPSPASPVAEPQQFHQRWRRIQDDLQTAQLGLSAASAEGARQVLAQMSILGDVPRRSRETHGLLLRAACLAEQLRHGLSESWQAGQRGASATGSSRRDRVLRLHQSLITALDHRSTTNMTAVAAALRAFQGGAGMPRTGDDSDWTELHCDALARQLVRILGSDTPDWLRLHTKT